MSNGPYILRKGVSSLNDLVGGSAAMGMGVGNVYYVIKSTEAFLKTTWLIWFLNWV